MLSPTLFSHRELAVPVASPAISVVPARTLRSPTAGIGTELLAHREIIEVTRSGARFLHSPVPMGRAIPATHAQFAHFHGQCLKPETGWRSGRTMARTGLRMMPTFPSSPLRFRTAGFPQYGSKAGLSDGACPCANCALGLHPSFVSPVA
jgi:hypothetical protein